ncbi:hypothetical protein HanXRQr2_Chr02g0070871 [Helianthus annuus]|uniref:Uncharacterized protein n=1 Tax=Helianthus annuus TaxID=4232 RepID=A0A9K3NZZ1_HELAN|nr:hypothetical protein HanXRQr2_Chr02g0070871 [Helianthus annuus]
MFKRLPNIFGSFETEHFSSGFFGEGRLNKKDGLSIIGSPYSSLWIRSGFVINCDGGRRRRSISINLSRHFVKLENQKHLFPPDKVVG